MDIALFEEMIRERIDSDTGVGGLSHASAPAINFHGEGFIQPGQRSPAIIYTFPPAAEDDTFQNDAVVYQVEFDVTTRRELNRLAPESAILKRLKGDAMAQADRQATYGFHRWKPTIAGYAATHMKRVTGVTAHTETERHFIELYEVRISENFTG